VDDNYDEDEVNKVIYNVHSPINRHMLLSIDDVKMTTLCKGVVLKIFWKNGIKLKHAFHKYTLKSKGRTYICMQYKNIYTVTR
jgi:hypothetical protein